MRILTVRLSYAFKPLDADETAQGPGEKRRDLLSAHGFDVTSMDDDQLCSYPVLGMSDTQFIELTIAGEKEMSIIATAIIEPSFD